jgi:hypothetical protein
MKIKVLLAPILGVIIVSLLVWWVYPAYTNGIDGVKEKYAELQKQIGITNSLTNRLDNVQKLIVDIDSDTTKRDVIFGYIPQKKEDEKIIENLNSLAEKNGMGVLNISVSEVKNDGVSVSGNVSNISDSSISSPSTTMPEAGVVPGQAQVASKVIPSKLAVNFSVFGSYDNIKTLLDNLYKMRMFNKVSTLEMKTLKNEDQSLSSNLQVTMSLEFDYLPDNYKLSDNDIYNPIFSSTKFDKSIADKIISTKNIYVSDVIQGEVGKNNPFLSQ